MCVLLVEDEVMIREIVAECLMDAGFEVHDVATGEEAIKAIKARGPSYIALITDYHMPGGANGAEVAASIRQVRPGIPVVIASGRPDVFDQAWREELGYSLLRKPYLARDLVSLVNGLLGKA